MTQYVALVTGGTGGIGTAICQHLCSKNVKVIASYNHRADHSFANAWKKEQEQLGYNNMVAYYADVRDYSSCKTLIQQIESDYQHIDILVNNAGINDDVQLYKMPLEAWSNVINTNLNSIFNVTRHVINGMMERNYGRIINISSVNGQKGQFGQTNYAAAKAGMHGFTKSLALEVARKGITVNTISPGYIHTQMLSSISEDILNKIIDTIPVKRLGKPEEVARMVAFLADEASGYITGANFSINGGQHLY